MLTALPVYPHDRSDLLARIQSPRHVQSSIAHDDLKQARAVIDVDPTFGVLAELAQDRGDEVVWRVSPDADLGVVKGSAATFRKQRFLIQARYQGVPTFEYIC